MMILEAAYAAFAVPGLSADGVMGLFRWVSAFAAQTVGQMGGMKTVELLAVAGFVSGFLACLYKLKHIEG